MSAFADLTAGIRSLLSQWGTVQAAAGMKLGTANLRTAMTTLGVFDTLAAELQPTWKDYQSVYGLAAANRNAFDRFAAAAAEAAVAESMIGLTPAARTLEARNAAPLTRLRARFTATYQGAQFTDWITVDRPGAFTLTKGEMLTWLRDQVTAALTATPAATEHYRATALLSVTLVTLVAA